MSTVRRLTGVMLSLLVVSGCQPPSVAVSSLQDPPVPPPAPAADAVPQPPPSPPAPAVAAPPAVPADIALTVDLPPGTWQRLQRPFSTQAAVSPQDLPIQAVKALRLTVNGQPCPDDDWSVEGLQWTATGGIQAALRIRQPLTDKPCDISLGNANRSLYLRLKTNRPQGATLSIQSTAIAFLAVAMGTNAELQQVPDYIVGAIAGRLLNLMIRPSGDAITSDASLLSLLRGLASILQTGKIPTPSDVQAIEQGAGVGGPGGGSASGGGGPAVLSPPVHAGPLTEAVTVQQTTAASGTIVVGPNQAACQTFVAPGTGVCTGFAVDVASAMAVPGTQLGGDGLPNLDALLLPAKMRLSLYATANGMPTGAPLASSVVLADPGGGFVNGPTLPVPVTGGATYAIVIEPQEGASVSVPASTGDPYGQGQAMTYNGGWTGTGTRDLRFRITLAP